MEIRTIGNDLGKTVFHLVGVNSGGEVVVRKKCSRLQLLRFHIERPFLPDRHGGLCRFPSFAAEHSGERSRCAADTEGLCAATPSHTIEKHSIGRKARRLRRVIWFLC